MSQQQPVWNRYSGPGKGEGWQQQQARQVFLGLLSLLISPESCLALFMISFVIHIFPKLIFFFPFTHTKPSNIYLPPFSVLAPTISNLACMEIQDFPPLLFLMVLF